MDSLAPPSTFVSERRASSLAEILSALSLALDLTEDAVAGHALRCTLIGMRMGRALELPSEMLKALYVALQLKDVGCSSNADRMTILLGGDDRKAKAAAKLSDWTSLRALDLETLRTLWSTVLPDKHWSKRVLRILHLGLQRNKNNKEIIGLRCTRGAEIVSQLGFGVISAEAVYRLDEHWDGRGYPGGLRGTSIPLIARICSLAQTLDAFACEEGQEAAARLITERSGRWFDPSLVALVEDLHESGELWRSCEPGCFPECTRLEVLAQSPLCTEAVGEREIDEVCEAFAGVIDAKSPFTYEHSLRVSHQAVSIGREMRLDSERLLLLRRAGLLHDLGNGCRVHAGSGHMTGANSDAE